MKFVNRTIALLLVVQMVVSPIVNFALQGPAFAKPAGFLVNAAPHAFELAVAVLLGLALSATSLGVAIAGWPVFRRHSERMALWLVVLGGVLIALAALEYVGLMSMMSLSQAYAAAGSPEGELYQALRGVVGSARNWAHFLHLLCGGGLLFAFYLTLYRFALVPRLIGAAGALGSLLQMTAIALALFGRPVMFVLMAPLAIAHAALIFWLLVRGLREPTAS
jgi:hypothetical protein